MPASTKAKWAQLRVGLMAIAALTILAVLIFLMTSTHGIFRSKTHLYTYMGDSTAILPGAPVSLNGITIGKVAKVALSGINDPRRVVKIDMEVEDQYLDAIPVDSQAGLA